jgi:hypothetical protein
MAEHRHSPENTRRIHALVRAAYSPAVWGMALISVLLTSSRMLAASKGAPPWIGPLVLTVVVILFIYLTAGACEVFARSSAPVSLGQAFRAAGHVFGSFLWLMLKASLVGFVLFEAIMMVVVGVIGVEPFKNPKATADLFTVFASIVALVLVYWVPIVFVRRNFRLFETLGLALRTVRERPGSMLFLAILLWTPVAILTFTGDEVPLLLVIPVVILGEWLRWAAYAYCVDVVASMPAPTVSAGGD